MGLNGGEGAWLRSHLAAHSHWKMFEEGPRPECSKSAGPEPLVGSAEYRAAVASGDPASGEEPLQTDLLPISPIVGMM